MMKKQSLKTKGIAKRRALLKSTAAGGLMVFGNVAPESWIRPVVNSMLLPAHAQTTQASDNAPAGAPVDIQPDPPPVINSCSGESATIRRPDQFALDIVYDATSSPKFSIRDTAGGRIPDDTILSVSTAPSFAMGAGENWEVGIPRVESNVADGLYTRSIRRMIGGTPTDPRYEITFCIATAGEDTPDADTRTLTLTLVSITKS